jgi:hypothetical protein
MQGKRQHLKEAEEPEEQAETVDEEKQVMEAEKDKKAESLVTAQSATPTERRIENQTHTDTH